MKTAEQLAKQIEAMTMTHDLHWQNIKPLIEARDAEIRDQCKPLVEALEELRSSFGLHLKEDANGVVYLQSMVMTAEIDKVKNFVSHQWPSFDLEKALAKFRGGGE